MPCSSMRKPLRVKNFMMRFMIAMRQWLGREMAAAELQHRVVAVAPTDAPGTMATDLRIDRLSCMAFSSASLASRTAAA
jgi:hypothetical protein